MKPTGGRARRGSFRSASVPALALSQLGGDTELVARATNGLNRNTKLPRDFADRGSLARVRDLLASLAALAAEDLDDPQCLRDARRLLREALSACLEGRNLRSREVMAALRQREVKA